MTVLNRASFFGAEQTQHLGQWDDLLSLQVHLFLPAELAFLAGLPAWRRAAEVLDAGCGNGDYVAALARFFPDKSFTGVDPAVDLIQTAVSRHAKDKVRFVRGALPNLPIEPVDFAILRFVVQHLEEPAAQLDRLADSVRAGGHVLILESDLAGSANIPPTSLFQSHLSRFIDTRQSRGFSGDAKQIAARCKRWCRVQETAIAIPNIGPAINGPVMALYNGWLDLIEGLDPVRFSGNACRRELAAWAMQPDVLSVVCLSATLLQRF